MSTRAATAAGRRRATRRGRAAGRAAAPGRSKSAQARPTSAPGRPKRSAGRPKRSAAPRRPARSQPKASPRRTRRPPSHPRRARAARSFRRPSLASPASWVRAASWRRRLILVGVLALAVAGGYLLWLRDSSLVAITQVKVEGVTTEDRDQIVGALTDSAEGMTTLHVQGDELASVASRFPTVASVSVDTDFPHGAIIRVTERRPVLVARAGDREVSVAADGTLLSGLPPKDADVPVVDVADLPAAGRLTGDALGQAQVVGAAPAPLLAQVEKVRMDDQYGVVLTMHGGIEIRFGPATDAAAKWSAAAAVLADPKLTTLSYVDVTVPERPAVGGAGVPADVAPSVLSPLDATNPAAPTSTTSAVP